jgi:hypothetical protein
MFIWIERVVCLCNNSTEPPAPGSKTITESKFHTNEYPLYSMNSKNAHHEVLDMVEKKLSLLWKHVCEQCRLLPEKTRALGINLGIPLDLDVDTCQGSLYRKHFLNLN